MHRPRRDRSAHRRPLRILVLEQSRGVWGAQRYLLRLAPLLRESGIELVLGGPRSLELHDAWRDAGFSAVHLDLPIDRDIRHDGRPGVSAIASEARKGLSAARLIAGHARAENYDALWANGHWVHLEGSLAGRLCRTPVVLHLHEEAIPGLGQSLRAGAVRMSTRTVAVSRAVANGLPQFARRRVRTIANGVDTQLFAPASAAEGPGRDRLRAEFGVGPDDVMILAATRIDPSKRIEDLVEVARMTDDRRVRLVVAGSTSGYPDYEGDMRRQAARLGADRIAFCGGRGDMADLFRASDVVLHTGIVEGMPLGLLEAQACGKPVVAYAVAGVPEAVVDGITGLLAPPNDVRGLQRSLLRLAVDDGERTAMGSAARAHVLANHRIESQAQENAKVLSDMCARYSKGPE